MKVTQWAAAFAVSIAAFGAAPVFAQYPLYDSPSQTGSPVRATWSGETRPDYHSGLTPAPAYQPAPYRPGSIQPPEGNRVELPNAGQPGGFASGYAAPQAVAWPHGASPRGLEQNRAHVAPRNVSFPLNSPALTSPLNDSATPPRDVSALYQQGGQPQANPLPTPSPMPMLNDGRGAGQRPSQPATASPQTAPNNGAPNGFNSTPTQSQHSHFPGADCPTCNAGVYYQQPYRRQSHPLRGFAPHHEYPPAGMAIAPFEQESFGVGEYGFAAGGADACCEPPPCRSPWYFTYKSLILTRDNENEVWFSYDTANIASQILGSLDARMGWRFGADFRLGKYLDEGHHSVEMVYFGIFSGHKEANAYGADMAGNLDSSFVFDSLTYNPGGGPTAVAGLFNNAERHQLVRSYRAHNAEVNLWRHAVQAACGKDAFRSARISWLAGLRYMNYSEGFHFAADPYDNVFGNQPSEELRYDVSVNNHLFGFQVGGMGEFCLSNRWQFTSTVKAGVMANRMDLTSFIGSSQRSAYVDNVASPYNGERFDIRSTKNDVSLLGELELGMRYRWSDYWSITGGYRAIGLSGVGLSTNQVPVYFADIGGVRQIDSNASLILHGVLYWGAEFNY